MSFTFDRRAATEDERSALGRPWLPPSVYALLMAAIALLMYFIVAVFALLTSVTLINAVVGSWLNDQPHSPVAISPWMEPLLITVLWGPVFLVPLRETGVRVHFLATRSQKFTLRPVLEDLTVKRLTRGNPTMTAKFAELKSQHDSEEQ